MNVAAMLVWTGCGVILLTVLMWIDSLMTKYSDIAEMKKGNVAVTTRFILKLFAQGYILAKSIATSNSLWEALLVSAVSFLILLLIETIVERLFKAMGGLDLNDGTKNAMVSHGLLAGSLHVTGALIIAACL
ncbi:DUF350 domain-containing protein [Paenibacillus thermoaerophilus]